MYIYKYGVYIYIYIHITSIFYYDSPKMDLFHLGSYYSPAIGGDSWGIIAFLKTWGVEREKAAWIQFFNQLGG